MHLRKGLWKNGLKMKKPNVQFVVFEFDSKEIKINNIEIEDDSDFAFLMKQQSDNENEGDGTEGSSENNHDDDNIHTSRLNLINSIARNTSIWSEPII